MNRLATASHAARLRLPAVFAYGFRPFFLLAALQAVIAVLGWVAVLLTGVSGWTALPPALWHGHEMIFGFVAAAIAGFLLTAVPSWTGAPACAGWPLALLAGLWLAGRFALGLPGVPEAVGAALDLAFLPALALVLGPPLIHAGQRRNLPFLAIFAALFAADLLFHGQFLGWTGDTARPGLLLAIDIVLVLVVVIGGRIIPAFTANWLRRRGRPAAPAPAGWIDPAAIAATVLVAAVDLVAPDTPAAGAMALAAAVLHALRLARWRGLATLREPLLWVLHLGYAWIVVALALKAAWLLAGAGFAANWLHALTIGVFATMILAVMTRVALGHTGRELIAPGPAVAAYLSITLAALARVFGPAFGAATYAPSLAVAGAAWVAAFLLFLAAYAPILLRPRCDGRPG